MSLRVRVRNHDGRGGTCFVFLFHFDFRQQGYDESIFGSLLCALLQALPVKTSRFHQVTRRHQYLWYAGGSAINTYIRVQYERKGCEQNTFPLLPGWFATRELPRWWLASCNRRRACSSVQRAYRRRGRAGWARGSGLRGTRVVPGTFLCNSSDSIAFRWSNAECDTRSLPECRLWDSILFGALRSADTVPRHLESENVTGGLNH